VNLTEHAIRLRTANRVSVSQPADFVLDAGQAVERSRIFEPDVSPYCFDFDHRLLLCVSTPEIAGATFFYQAQREQAGSLIKVPLEVLPEPDASPALIFSIGRCGSTLLHKAFEAAGARSVSEPDYFTQAALYRRLDPTLRDAIGRATRLLPYSVIKLRAECSNAALLIASAFRTPRLIFILRDAMDWAVSVHRVSDRTATPTSIAGLLRALLGGLDDLTRHHEVRICYYEDFRSLGASYINAALAWMGSDARLSAAAAAALAGQDAQEGSPVSRAEVEGRSEDPTFRAAFRYEWSRLRPAALIERLGLRRL
jgi:hypothetical protein